MDGAFHIDIAEALARKGIEITIVAPVPYVPFFISALSTIGVPPLLRWMPGGQAMARLSQAAKKIKIYKQLPYYECKGGINIYRPRYFGYYKHLHYGAIHKFMFFAVKNIFRKESRHSCNHATMQPCHPTGDHPKGGSQKPDLIHAHFAYPMGMLALQLSKYWKIPYVLTLWGNDVYFYPFFNKCSNKRFKKAIFGAAKVFAVSRSLAQTTQELTGIKPIVFPNVLDLSVYENLPDKSAARKILNLPSDKFIILFAGQFIKRKNINVLLQAINAFEKKNVLGVFCGYGPLNGLIKSTSGVVSLGLLPNDMIPLVMSAADLFVLPSYNEGMPTVLIEAGAVGLPVIGSAVGGITDLLADGRGLLIESGSVKAIVEAINKVRSDYQSALQRAGKLKKYVEKHYNVDKNAEIIINEYNNIIQKVSDT